MQKYYLHDFMKKNQRNSGRIIDVLQTKVALNIINSFNLVFPTFDFNYITNYDLLKNENKRFVLIKLSKQKYYLHDFMKKNQRNSGRIIDVLQTKEDFNIVNGYKEFNKKVLEEKLIKNKFKK